MKTRSFLFLPLEFWLLSLMLHLLIVSLARVHWGKAPLDLTGLTVELVSQKAAVPDPAAPRTLEEVWRSPEHPRIKPQAAAPTPSEPPPAPVSPAPSANIGEAGPPHVYSVAELAQLPQPLVKVKPAYPIEARRQGIEGVVTFQVDIDATGAVKKVRLVKGLGFGCDEAAMDALWKTSFTPAISPDGHAVPAQRSYSFGFDLNDVNAP